MFSFLLFTNYTLLYLANAVPSQSALILLTNCHIFNGDAFCL